MKNSYVQEIKRSFKSPEYWFAFTLIIVTSAWTALYHLDRYGVLNGIEIGTAEFFFSCVMLGNTLLQISVPIIPIFVTMQIWEKEKKDSTREIFAKGLASITISSSIFFLSFALIFIVGLIFFPNSTGAIKEIGGPFSDLYYQTPNSIILIKIIYSCIFASVYSLLGMGIGMNLKNKLFALFTPLIYYFCFNYIEVLLPSSFRKISYWIVPLDTFSIANSNTPLDKKIVELSFVLIIALILFAIAIWRRRREVNTFSDNILSSCF